MTISRLFTQTLLPTDQRSIVAFRRLHLQAAAAGSERFWQRAHPLMRLSEFRMSECQLSVGNAHIWIRRQFKDRVVNVALELSPIAAFESVLDRHSPARG